MKSEWAASTDKDLIFIDQKPVLNWRLRVQDARLRYKTHIPNSKTLNPKP
jgi:hypothetical protein